MNMTDAVKMAIEALRPFAEIVEDVKESASGLQNDRDDFFLTQIGGYKVADLFTDDFVRAAEALAALEQAGEPVAGVLGDIQRFHKSYICLGGDDDGEEYVRWSDVLAALPTLQRLGQEFDAGEAMELARDAAARYFENDPLDKARKEIAAEIRKGERMDYQDATQAALYGVCAARRAQAGDAGQALVEAIIAAIETEQAKHLANDYMLDTDECIALIRCVALTPPQSRVAAEPVGLRDISKLLDRLDNLSPKVLRVEMRLMILEAAQMIRDLSTPSQPDPQSRGQAFDGEREVLKKAAEIAGDVFWNLPMPSHWDRDKEEYVRWCSRQSKFVREQIAALSSAKRGED